MTIAPSPPDDSAKADPGGAPVFVLVRPQMGENIGAAARAMWNFGLESMRLVAPRDGWPNARAGALASGAGRVLDAAGVFADTPAALADCNFILATTARPRELTKVVMTPEAAMRHAASLIAAGDRVAVLFGPERAGLENDDVIRADAIVSVPVNPLFASLNLAQCVLLLAYEWRRATVEAPAQEMHIPRGRLANGADIEHLSGHLIEKLDSAGFFWPEHKRDSMETNLRNLLARLPLTDADTRTLHGVIRALARGQAAPK